MTALKSAEASVIFNGQKPLLFNLLCSFRNVSINTTFSSYPKVLQLNISHMGHLPHRDSHPFVSETNGRIHMRLGQMRASGLIVFFNLYFKQHE